MFFAMMISSISAVVSHITAMYSMAEHRFSKKISQIIWLIYGVLTIVFWIFLNSNANENQFLFAYYGALILQIILFFIITKGSLGQRIFLLITYIVLFSVTTGIIDIFRYKIFADQLGWKSTIVNVCVIILLMWIFLKILLPLVKKTGCYIEKWWSLCLISAMFYIVVVSLTIWPRSLINASANDIFIYFLFVLLVCAVYPILFGNIKVMAQISLAKQIELQRNMLLAQIDAQREVTETAKRFHHDLRHHNLLIIDYAKANDLDGLLNYLGESMQIESKESFVNYCDNDILSHIISAYVNRAKNSEIKTEIIAQVCNDINISKIHLVSIVANVLENAIHGCEKCERYESKETFINLQIHEKFDKLVIHCENSCKENFDFEKSLPSKLKSVGISSIEDAASHYEGLCEFTAKNGIFSCGIILNLNRKY